MTTLTQISNTELQVGNIVHFHGARFEIVSTDLQKDHRDEGNGDIMVAMGKWLDGEVVQGYFGPTKQWNFQGNKLAIREIEC